MVLLLVVALGLSVALNISLWTVAKKLKEIVNGDGNN